MVSGVGALLERESEVARLEELLSVATDGTGAAAVVTGPAGIGKTRLIRTLRRRAEHGGVRVLAARGAELERDYAFGVVRQWFDPLLRDGGLPPLTGAAALAEPVLRGTPGEAADASFAVLHGLYWCTAALASAEPLLLVLDDAHWSDDASLRFAGFLAHRLEGLGVLLVLATRTEIELPAERLELRPLGVAAVAELLRERAGEVDDVFAAACHEATGGNPFLLTELTQALLDEGVTFAASERGRVRSIGPRSVATAVQLRLARLPASAGALARAAAVAGDDAPLAVVAEIAGVDADTAAAAADELARIGILEDVRPLRFVHPIVGAAIGDSLLAGEREALHGKAARVLEAAGAPTEAIAVHLLAVAPSGDEQVAATLAAAGRRALREGAPEAAATLLGRALAEPPPAADRARLLLGLGEAEHALERTSATARLREAYALADDPRDRARAALLLTWAVVSAPDAPRDLDELLDGAIAALPPEERDLALRLEAAWLGVAWDRSRLDAILERGERWAGLAGATSAECLVLMQLAHAWLDAGRPAADVIRLAERAARAEFVGDLAANSIWLIHANASLGQAERYSMLVPLMDVAVREAQRRGSHRAYLLASMCRAAALQRIGDVDGSLADSWAAISGDPRDVILMPAIGIAASSLVEQGRLDEAERLYARHGLDGKLPEFRHGTLLLITRARLRAARGDHVRTLEDLTEARARLDRAGRRNVVGIDGRAAAALAHFALGRREVALAEVEVALDVAGRWGTPGAIGTAVHALGVVRGHLGALEHAVELLAQSPYALRLARALVEFGAALRRAGHRADSRAPLREAYAIADRGGAVLIRERAREELAASGVRVRRVAERGVASLTPSERRVAERAAAGASNPEIAQELFVTVKTVEMHLSNAYRKLGISGRRDLARALG